MAAVLWCAGMTTGKDVDVIGKERFYRFVVYCRCVCVRNQSNQSNCSSLEAILINLADCVCVCFFFFTTSRIMSVVPISKQTNKSHRHTRAAFRFSFSLTPTAHPPTAIIHSYETVCAPSRKDGVAHRHYFAFPLLPLRNQKNTQKRNLSHVVRSRRGLSFCGSRLPGSTGCS